MAANAHPDEKEQLEKREPELEKTDSLLQLLTVPVTAQIVVILTTSRIDICKATISQCRMFVKLQLILHNVCIVGPESGIFYLQKHNLLLVPRSVLSARLFRGG